MLVQSAERFCDRAVTALLVMCRQAGTQTKAHQLQLLTDLRQLIVLLLLAAGYYWIFGTGWDALAALIFGMMSIAPAVGCVLAAGVHRFGAKIPRK